MEIKSASDIKLDKLRILGYGDYKTGKTEFASTFPKPFFFDFDDGMLTLRGKQVDYRSYKGIPKDDLWDLFLKELDEVGKMDYETIVIDSLTTAASAALDKILFLNKRTNKNNGYPQKNDWGPQMVEIVHMVEKLQKMDKHIVMLAHEKAVKEEITGRIWMLPLVTGNLARRIGLYFDEIYHLEATTRGENTTYKILIRPNSIYTAGSRIFKTRKSCYIEPSYDYIMNNLEIRK